MMVTSTAHGPLDLTAPAPLPGRFPWTIACDPVSIDAPAMVVWQVLTDFAAYGDWNPYTPRIKGPCVLDGHIRLHVRLKRGVPMMVQTERITVLEAGRVLGWSVHPGSAGLRVERMQWIEPLADARCRYRSFERFSGLLLPGTRRLTGRRLEQGLADVAEALRRRAELISARMPDPVG